MKLKVLQWIGALTLLIVTLYAVTLPAEAGGTGRPVFAQTTFPAKINAVNSNLATGTISGGGGAWVQLTQGQNIAGVHIDGTYVGTLVMYESLDGVHRYVVTTTQVTKQSDGSTGITANDTGDWSVSAPPGSTVYIFCTVYTSGTANVTMVGGSGGGSSGGGGGGAVTNAGTFAVQLTGATNNINNIAGTISLPTGAATSALESTINATLGTPFQAGGSIGNTGFNVTGTLPAFAATPTFNLGTLNGAATAAGVATVNTTLGSPFQAGGSIGNTTFASTESGTWTVQPGNTANTTPWLVTGKGQQDSGGTDMTDTTLHALTVRTTVYGAVTDGSGTITAGASAQTLFASNATRKYLLIVNNSTQTLWINFTATAVQAQPSIQIAANGGSFLMQGAAVSNEAVSIIGPTTGQSFTAKQMDMGWFALLLSPMLFRRRRKRRSGIYSHRIVSGGIYDCSERGVTRIEVVK